jgi:hypothetical protein
MLFLIAEYARDRGLPCKIAAIAFVGGRNLKEEKVEFFKRLGRKLCLK